MRQDKSTSAAVTNVIARSARPSRARMNDGRKASDKARDAKLNRSRCDPQRTQACTAPSSGRACSKTRSTTRESGLSASIVRPQRPAGFAYVVDRIEQEQVAQSVEPLERRR